MVYCFLFLRSPFVFVVLISYLCKHFLPTDFEREWKEGGHKEGEGEGEKRLCELPHTLVASCLCPIHPGQAQGWDLSHTGQGIV